jgi:hypothetical protein
MLRKFHFLSGSRELYSRMFCKSGCFGSGHSEIQGTLRTAKHSFPVSKVFFFSFSSERCQTQYVHIFHLINLLEMKIHFAFLQYLKTKHFIAANERYFNFVTISE